MLRFIMKSWIVFYLHGQYNVYIWYYRIIGSTMEAMVKLEYKINIISSFVTQV